MQVVHVEQGRSAVVDADRQGVGVVAMDEVHIGDLPLDGLSELPDAACGSNSSPERGHTHPMTNQPHSVDHLPRLMLFLPVERVHFGIMACIHQPAGLAQHARVGCARVGDDRSDACHGAAK